MIQHILTVGDSFTFGEELADRNQAYPHLLAQRMGATVTNLAKPGSGNKRMVRSVIEHLSQGHPVDLVIIGWSSAGRMEFADQDGFYDIWPGYSGNMFLRDGQTWRRELLEYVNRHHNAEYLYRQYLLDVVLVQSYLKQQGTHYVMLNTVFNEYYHRSYYDAMPELTTQIDPDHYLGWPTQGMCEWTMGCPVGPNGHFLQAGHQRVADKLYEHIGNRGWLS
jgi:hypothetical protein